MCKIFTQIKFRTLLKIKEMNITSNGDIYIVGKTTATDAASFPLTVEQVNDYQQNYGGGAFDARVRRRLDWRIMHGDGGCFFFGVEPFSHWR